MQITNLSLVQQKKYTNMTMKDFATFFRICHPRDAPFCKKSEHEAAGRLSARKQTKRRTLPTRNVLLLNAQTCQAVMIMKI